MKRAPRAWPHLNGSLKREAVALTAPQPAKEKINPFYRDLFQCTGIYSTTGEARPHRKRSVYLVEPTPRVVCQSILGIFLGQLARFRRELIILGRRWQDHSQSDPLAMPAAPIDLLYEVSRLLSVPLDREMLATAVKMLEDGANPEALAALVHELHAESRKMRGATPGH